jgi:hydroxypyruvate reductase/glycerate 2-kinase
MLRLLASAGPDDTALCLLSGGGSALLPCPAEGVSLESKLAVTKLLHASGATIGEMNCVRKHLSRVKGGRLAEAFRGKRLISLIISDVVGDPLDVIASGPTALDPTTFADAKQILERYSLWAKCPADVTTHLQKGCDGLISDTPKALPANVENRVIGNNALALTAARRTAEQLGYHVLDLGPFVEGETKHVAAVVAGVVRNIREREEPLPVPACILIGGDARTESGEGGSEPGVHAGDAAPPGAGRHEGGGGAQRGHRWRGRPDRRRRCGGRRDHPARRGRRRTRPARRLPVFRQVWRAGPHRADRH